MGFRILSAITIACVSAWAQERAGEAQIGFQHYYLTDGSRPLANAMGVTANFREFLPRVGVLTVNLMPAANNGRFQTGTSFAELKQLPFARHYWTLRGGDFRISGRVLGTPFNNLYFPDIAGRGGLVETTHGNRTIGAFYGAETLQAGVRLPLRLVTSQTMLGAYYRETVSDRLEIGARFLDLSNNLSKLRQTPQLTMPLNPLQHARTGTFAALYTVAGKLKWYSEAGAATAAPDSGAASTTSSSFSTGPTLDTKRVTLRANYVRQSESYLPLLGYSLGDRQGSFGELRVRPLGRIEVYGSGSEYRSNLSRDPMRPTYRSISNTVGMSLTLPSRFTISSQASEINLTTRRSDADARVQSHNQQFQVTVTRPLAGHSLRVSAREFHQNIAAGKQRQRTLEAADNVKLGPLSVGALVRGQKGSGVEARTTVYVQSNAQLSFKHFFVYANVQTGNDLANRTLFATSATNSIVLGGAAQARNWEFSVDAYRNRLVTELNPENIFVLQGQGVAVPTVLAAINQWSLYVRMSKRLEWGNVASQNVMSLDTYAAQRNLLKGSVAGFVFTEDHRGAEGIPISIDGGSATFTDSAGKFQLENVGEGIHKVGIALDELPADFDPGKTTSLTLLVRPSVASRADFDVVSVGYVLRGSVTGPAEFLQDRVIRLLPGDRYTTTNKDGEFAFYNIPHGDYQMELAKESLPPFSTVLGAATVPVIAGSADQGEVRFEFEVKEPPKPLKQIVLQAAGPVAVPTVAVPPVIRTTQEEQAIATALPTLNTSNTAPAAKSSVKLYEQGRSLNNAEKFREATLVFTEAIKINSSDPLLYNARGFAWLRLNQYQQASDDFSEAIRLKPNYSNAFHNRAVARKKLGDALGAREDEKKSLQLAVSR